MPIVHTNGTCILSPSCSLASLYISLSLSFFLLLFAMKRNHPCQLCLHLGTNKEEKENELHNNKAWHNRMQWEQGKVGNKKTLFAKSVYPFRKPTTSCYISSGKHAHTHTGSKLLITMESGKEGEEGEERGRDLAFAASQRAALEQLFTDLNACCCYSSSFFSTLFPLPVLFPFPFSASFAHLKFTRKHGSIL